MLSCVDFLTDQMPFVVGRIYVSKKFDKNSKNEVYTNNYNKRLENKILFIILFIIGNRYD